MYKRRTRPALDRAFLVLVTLLSVSILIVACSSAPAAAPTQAPAAAAPAPTTAPAAPAPTTAAAPAATSAPAAAPTQAPAVTLAPMTDVKPKKKYNMGFANWSEAVSFSVEVRKSLQAAADKFGVNLVVMDNKGDVQQANTNVDNVLTQKLDFFFEYQGDPEANKKIAQRLTDAKMKSIAIQVAMPGYPFYVVDNVQGGKVGGELLGKASKAKFGDNAKLLVIGIPESGPAFISRAEGAIKGVQEFYPNVSVTQASSKNDPNVTRQVVTDFLTANPTSKVMIWTHVDEQALAAQAAVKAANRMNDVLISSLGGEQIIFPELRNKDSIILGTASFYPEKWGFDLIPLAIKWLDDGVVPPPLMNPPMAVVTKDNVNQLYPQ